MKRRLAHAEWREDLIGDIAIEWFAGGDLDDAAQHIHGQAVVPGVARRKGERETRDAVAELLQCAPVIENIGLEIDRIDGAISEEAIRESRRMCEQMLDRYWASRRLENGTARRSAGVDPRRGERWNEPGDRIVEMKFPLVDQPHRSGG